ncbi:hypothetical protein TrLO_g12148 [Triparma laevis f. longispina]|uniref:Uncharacterized protein n=1 Tax=Triparma laevis f. longispina TaxID=1714387 RepID=A0A9W7FQD3_9STRA|nr:hypothetical protein TrLO_g12148 [Triparma laevis f. longispina]
MNPSRRNLLLLICYSCILSSLTFLHNPLISIINHRTEISTFPNTASANSHLFLSKTYDSGGTSNTTSWDSRETLPFVLKTNPDDPNIDPSSSSTNSLGTHHLPPLITSGDVLKIPTSSGPERYKVRRVRFLYKMDGARGRMRVTKKVLDVVRLGRERVERRLMKGLEGVEDDD